VRSSIFHAGEGWRYLAVVLDLLSRQVVGWSIKPHMKTELVVDALRMAWFRRRGEQGAIFHGDRGSQGFQRALKGHGLRSSMSRKGDCWDNAPVQTAQGNVLPEQPGNAY
jgi:transposase InsO family protein